VPLVSAVESLRDFGSLTIENILNSGHPALPYRLCDGCDEVGFRLLVVVMSGLRRARVLHDFDHLILIHFLDLGVELDGRRVGDYLARLKLVLRADGFLERVELVAGLEMLQAIRVLGWRPQRRDHS